MTTRRGSARCLGGSSSDEKRREEENEFLFAFFLLFFQLCFPLCVRWIRVLNSLNVKYLIYYHYLALRSREEEGAAAAVAVSARRPRSECQEKKKLDRRARSAHFFPFSSSTFRETLLFRLLFFPFSHTAAMILPVELSPALALGLTLILTGALTCAFYEMEMEGERRRELD